MHARATAFSVYPVKVWGHHKNVRPRVVKLHEQFSMVKKKKNLASVNLHSLKASQTYLGILGAVPSCYDPLSANNDRIEVINTHISYAKSVLAALQLTSSERNTLEAMTHSIVTGSPPPLGDTVDLKRVTGASFWR